MLLIVLLLVIVAKLVVVECLLSVLVELLVVEIVELLVKSAKLLRLWLLRKTVAGHPVPTAVNVLHLIRSTRLIKILICAILTSSILTG